MALASAAVPDERWVVLVSTRHATVLSLTSGTLVDFASAALGEVLVQQRGDPRGRGRPAKELHEGYVEQCGLASLRLMVLDTRQFAAYPSLSIYLDGVRGSTPLSRPMPSWAGCDQLTFDNLVASGAMDDALARGAAMQNISM